MSIKICLAEKKDAAKLKEFLKKPLEKIVRERTGEQGLSSFYAFVDKRVDYYLQNHFITLMKEDTGKIVGHVFFQAKEYPYLGVGEFEAVYLLEEYRKRGLGVEIIKKSIDFAEDYFRKHNTKIKTLYLLTRSSNEQAIRVYEKNKFQKQALIGKIFYDDQADEMFMVRFFR